MKFNLKNNKGFTLIEMVIVIAVIGILMGITFNGVRNVQGSARDTKRRADLKTVQTYLELYYNKYGHYPGDATGASPVTLDTTTGSSWSAFQVILRDSQIVGSDKDIPDDPLKSAHYKYYSLGDVSGNGGNTHYILGADMERGVPSDSVKDSVISSGGIDCTGAATKTYCLTN